MFLKNGHKTIEFWPKREVGKFIFVEASVKFDTIDTVWHGWSGTSFILFAQM